MQSAWTSRSSCLSAGFSMMSICNGHNSHLCSGAATPPSASFYGTLCLPWDAGWDFSDGASSQAAGHPLWAMMAIQVSLPLRRAPTDCLTGSLASAWEDAQSTTSRHNGTCTLFESATSPGNYPLLHDTILSYLKSSRMLYVTHYHQSQHSAQTPPDQAQWTAHHS